MASKPYAASGKYIQKQGDHCKSCRYDPKKVTGEGACPYNGLYWHFIDRHNELLSQNPRMGLILVAGVNGPTQTVSQCCSGQIKRWISEHCSPPGAVRQPLFIPGWVLCTPVVAAFHIVVATFHMGGRDAAD